MRLWSFVLGCAFFATAAFSAVQVQSIPEFSPNPALQEKFQSVLNEFPPLVEHEEAGGANRARLNQKQRDATYRALVEEKLAKKWFAALVNREGDEAFTIEARFKTWRGMLEFLQRRDAIVEVWAYGASANETPRRIPATELDELRRTHRDQPHFVTVTYRGGDGKPTSSRVEFGFEAAQLVWEAHVGYLRHRNLTIAGRAILDARGEDGRLTARSQWIALTNALAVDEFELANLPKEPKESDPLFVAIQYAVDENGNYARAEQLYAEDQITPAIEGDRTDSRQILKLNNGTKMPRIAEGFRVRGLSDELEPARNTLVGQDEVELRVRDAGEQDPRKWAALEFGAPEIFRRASLARFALLNAQMERRRKEVALKKSNIDLIAEPIIAGLNIGGGISGVGAPIGEIGRVFYNLIAPKWISKVPSVDEMREVFGILAARSRDPELSGKPLEFLTKRDVEQLRQTGRKLSDEEIQQYLASISDEDINAMVRLARMGMIDARVTNFLNLLTSVFKVTGASEQAGVVRDIFNNVRFAPNGDINLKTLIALAAGKRIWTPLGGVGLYDLSRGRGPAEAWAQFFEVSVDFRAVANSVTRWFKPTLAKKELEKPFPYATRLGDLAAYEFRAFGFPLLLFYKRGLIKADVAAYENDYAYGVIGTKLVVHYPTKADMEREILAGRLFPLGLVRVPDGKGGWKETNLPVFANKLESGKHKGKIALVIYGLKAYRDYSELMDREWDRFQQFERALKEGAVIERVIAAEERDAVPTGTFEPKITVGADASDTTFAPLLAELTEIRRVNRYAELGLTIPETDRSFVSTARERFATNGLVLGENDPLVEVDRFSSAFTYRRLRNGRWEIVKMTSIAGLEQIQRALATAEAEKEVAELRRAAAAGEIEGLALLHGAREVAGRYEVGPLLENRKLAIQSGASGMTQVFNWLEQLSIGDRARLVYNRFASTLVDLDLSGSGQKQRVFLSVEFPLGRATRTVTNALSGVAERQVFESGKPVRIISPHQIVEFDYDDHGTETATRTYWNNGTLETESKGALLQSTRTVRVWHRDMTQAGLDPYAPVIEKLKFDYITGQISAETYGLFPLPIQTADEQFVTVRTFDERGKLQAATLSENGRADADFARPPAAKVATPVKGRERFRLTSLPGAPQFQTAMRRDDLLRGLTRTVLFDDSRQGRPTEEHFEDGAFFRLVYEYRDDRWFGALPVRTTIASTNGVELRETTYLDVDPVLRRTTGVEADYRGNVITQVWDFRWSAPIESETATRKTTVAHDHAELRAEGRTIAKANGELLRTTIGVWRENAWQSVENWWYSPNVPLRTETNWLSGYGRFLRSTVGGQLETVAAYDEDGRETERRTLTRNRGNGAFDQVIRTEDDFRWDSGKRDARVRRFVDGALYDETRSQTDEEGRVVLEGLKKIGPLDLATRISYDGASERRTLAMSLLNGKSRESRQFAAPLQQDGRWVLPVVTTPAWGLVVTNFYDLADPFGRTRSSDLENGSRISVADWFEGSSIPKTSELHNTSGRVTRRWETRLRAGQEGSFAFDLVTVSEVSPWGDAAPSERRAIISGTDLPLFKEGASERTYYALGEEPASPQFARRIGRPAGLTIQIGGERVTNVTRIFKSERVRERGSEVLQVEQINLLGFFEHGFQRQYFDRAGNLLREENGTIPARASASDAEIFFTAVANAATTKRFFHRYEQGSWFANSDARLNVPTWTFTNSPGPLPVNQDGRETTIAIDGFAGQSESTNALRSVSSQRRLKSNPWLPHLSGPWIEWTSAQLGPDGRPTSQSVALYDSEGTPVVTRSKKGAAEKIAFDVPLPHEGEWISVQAGTADSIEIPLRLTNTAGSYFVYFFLKGSAEPPLATFKDSAGHAVTAVTERSSRPNSAAFWPVGGGHVLWSPQEFDPHEGISLNGTTDGELWAIPTASLAAAGLDPAKLDTLTVRAGPGTINYTAAFTIQRVGRPGEFTPQRLYQFTDYTFSSGLRAVTRYEPVGQGEDPSLVGWKTMLLWNGVPVLTGWQEDQISGQPRLIVADYSDPDAPRPLYALDATDGQFIQWFQIFKNPSQTRIYSVVNGFESPRLEIFRSDAMSDELRPSSLAYGRDVPVVVPLGRPSADGGSGIENLKTRLHASAFKYAGDRTLAIFGGGSEAAEDLERLNQNGGSIERQPARIARLPILAEALIPFRELPWRLAQGGTSAPPVATNVLAVRLRRLATLYPTGLIPTSPDAQDEAFVDTTLEGELIQLALQCGAGALAGDVLDFYWTQSRGGTEPLFDSYDASNGASVLKSPIHKRPLDARRSARSQLAISEAALHFAAATGDTNALHLGQRLLQTLLTDYRTEIPGQPAGISEEIADPLVEQMGFALLPAAPRFSLGTNARLYTLLRKIDRWLSAQAAEGDSVWRTSIREALRDQEHWLRAHYLDDPERLAAAPMGLFQLQDAATGAVALGEQRWTATEDWLDLIQAADHVGIAKETTRRWLANLARAHGAYVSGNWGLDWTVPWRRPEAISTRLTARFQEIASQIGDTNAARFARAQLAALADARGELAAVYTSAHRSEPLLTGTGAVLYSSDDRKRWPGELAAYHSLLGSPWLSNLSGTARMRATESEGRDMSAFFWTAAAFYLAILAMTLFWWALNAWRKRRQPLTVAPIVPASVMQRGEERWAKRVLGVKTPADAERSRFSNAPVEENFHIQLRAIYKVVLEWRRIENGWEVDDPRLVEYGADPWLNGLDEFAAMIGIYSRWVVKAGKKDGFAKGDPFEENEDSNHIWSRLVFYLSEYLWGLLQLLKHYQVDPEAARVFGTNEQFQSLLRVMGARARREAFDARDLFDFPAKADAMDILPLQLPGATLAKLAEQMQERLKIPVNHFRGFLKNYKTFKHREQVDPIHPYIIEAAKLFPHFLLMGLVSVIWYNQDVNGLLIYPYLKQLVMNLLQSARSLWWAVPLLLGACFSLAAKYVHFYRYTGTIRARKKESLMLDADVGNLMGSAQSVLPSIHPGRAWDPVWYERIGWVLRGAGFVTLAYELMQASAPSLATFMLVKGIFVPFLAVEAAAILVPLIVTVFSRWQEDRVSSGRAKSTFSKFVNQLNLVPTRPASILALSVKYHFQSSLPSGGIWAMTRCIALYFIFTATFFLIGSYSYKEVLRVWFAQRYHQAWDWELAIGSLIFWNTMYLLRFGLFIFFVSVASFAVTFPLQAVAVVAGIACGILALANPAWAEPFLNDSWALVAGAIVLAGLALMEPWLKARWQSSVFGRRRAARKDREQEAGLADLRNGKERALAVVYMSGDDLSFLKLTPELLLSRLKVLREKLGSEGATVLLDAIGVRGDEALTALWGKLYALEKKHDTTLWHPMQLVVGSETPGLKSELGLNLTIETAAERDAILDAWQTRRWLVTMMSTAGHGQDTGINLVDIALRLTEHGLAQSTAFYLIQNKYDNADTNRPSQMKYGGGELGHRNKLARLLMEVAPGARSYSINDWTPFGFKAGGMVGMDFIHEEALKLSNMLVLDRNANTHDLTSLMEDLKGALSDPGVIIVVPGRSTTNALTPLGQASQLVEEGHRALLKGVMALGGGAGESVGTGWGNIQAISYGQVQRALLDPNMPKMPLTSRMRRGSSLQERSHGLIGFGPHAVGISEDIWGVTQASHNALALGRTVKFRQSRAFWHKIRETWSHAEWFSAFPRWSGGYLQLMLDPLMQRINDFGPLSVFAKEIRANCGRFFLSVPFALLNILLMPLAIIYDVSPFVQILVVLWLFGLVMNQVLTMLGAVAYLESSGFKKLAGVAGGAAVGAATLLNPAWSRFLPAGILLGFVGGGFAAGLSKWLFNRGRDLIVFGPQLVIHALGQFVRQSLEFVLSGASADDARGVNIAFRGWVGPREDRPWESYANFINMRTVVWGVGLLSLALNMFALAHLDFLNALLLLPSLFFSISTLAGPFLMAPKRGSEMGAAAALPKVGGWIAGFGFFSALAFLLTREGPFVWMGLALLVVVLGAVFRSGLRYVGYARRLQGRQKALAGLIENAGIAAVEAARLATQAVRVFQGDAAKLKAALANVDPAAQEKIAKYSETQLKPLLRKPVLDVHGPHANTGRWRAEFSRSFALSLFTLVWFLLVPLPGLLVFSGLGYRLSVPLPQLWQAVLVLFAVALLAYAPVRLFERLSLKRRHKPRVARLFARLRALTKTDGALTPGEASTLFASFTDAVTYADQRAYAYASRTLDEAENVLARVELRVKETATQG